MVITIAAISSKIAPSTIYMIIRMTTTQIAGRPVSRMEVTISSGRPEMVTA